MEDWLWAEAVELGRGIAKGEIDPVALTDAYLAAIDAHEFRDRIYVRVTPDRARAEATAAARRAKLGQRRSLLDGVPISWKDLFDTAGIPTEAGSALLRDRTPNRDARVLRAATAAGLVCLGKTHMTELAFSGLGVNPVTATPPNVNDTARVPGGSSSGAAASVAFGLAAAAIGSDTGGSVRTPSAWNDLVGLKTAPGTLSLDGVVPLAARFDTVGPLCRSVSDAAALFAALGGRRSDLSSATLRGVRLAVLETVALEDIQPAPLAAFRSAVERLNAAGAEIDRVDVPGVVEAMTLTAPLYGGETWGTWGNVIETNPDAMYHPVLARFRSGRDVTAQQFVRAWQRLKDLRRAYASATAGYHAILLPTVPTLPPAKEAVEADAELFASENLMALRNTRIGNLMGLAGVTLPTGVSSCGLLLQGEDEARLLRLAAAAEVALS